MYDITMHFLLYYRAMRSISLYRGGSDCYVHLPSWINHRCLHCTHLTGYDLIEFVYLCSLWARPHLLGIKPADRLLQSVGNNVPDAWNR